MAHEIRRVLRPGGTAVIATHVGHGEETVEASPGTDPRLSGHLLRGDELAALAEVHRLIPTASESDRRSPTSTRCTSSYLTAVAT